MASYTLPHQKMLFLLVTDNKYHNTILHYRLMNRKDIFRRKVLVENALIQDYISSTESDHHLQRLPALLSMDISMIQSDHGPHQVGEQHHR